MGPVRATSLLPSVMQLFKQNSNPTRIVTTETAVTALYFFPVFSMVCTGSTGVETKGSAFMGHPQLGQLTAESDML